MYQSHCWIKNLSVGSETNKSNNHKQKYKLVFRSLPASTTRWNRKWLYKGNNFRNIHLIYTFECKLPKIYAEKVRVSTRNKWNKRKRANVYMYIRKEDIKVINLLQHNVMAFGANLSALLRTSSKKKHSLKTVFFYTFILQR